jgi:hypothetical protein
MKTACILTFVVPAVALAGEFENPVMVMAGGEPVRVESPGYACPSWADWDGDGKPDLLVGQFNKGKIAFYKNEGGEGVPKFAKGTMILTGKKPAEVPGVW